MKPCTSICESFYKPQLIPHAVKRTSDAVSNDLYSISWPAECPHVFQFIHMDGGVLWQWKDGFKQKNDLEDLKVHVLYQRRWWRKLCVQPISCADYFQAHEEIVTFDKLNHASPFLKVCADSAWFNESGRLWGLNDYWSGGRSIVVRGKLLQISRPIPSDESVCIIWIPRRTIPHVELNKFNWRRPTVVKTCQDHSFLLKELLDTLGNNKRLWPQLKMSRFMVCCPCCGQKKVPSFFSFKFHSFIHSIHSIIGAYSKCSKDDQGCIRIFDSYLHLLSRRTRASLNCSPIHFPCKTRPAFSRSCSKSSHPTVAIACFCFVDVPNIPCADCFQAHEEIVTFDKLNLASAFEKVCADSAWFNDSGRLWRL